MCFYFHINTLINNDLTLISCDCISIFVILYLMKIDIMKLITVKRQTKLENRFAPKMGRLQAKVTYIKKQFLGITLKTLHKYRETYYGEVKDCKDCKLAK